MRDLESAKVIDILGGHTAKVKAIAYSIMTLMSIWELAAGGVRDLLWIP